MCAVYTNAEPCLLNDGFSASGSNEFISSVSITEGQLQWLCHITKWTHTAHATINMRCPCSDIARISHDIVSFFVKTHITSTWKMFSWIWCTRGKRYGNYSKVLQVNCIACMRGTWNTHLFLLVGLFFMYSSSCSFAISASLKIE